MKPIMLCLLLLTPLCATEEGFTPLFNGKNLDGWKRVGGNGNYKVEGDHIVGTGKQLKANSFLRTEKTYRNFDFRFEMKFDDLSGNSGVMFRGLQKPGPNGRVYSYQCEHDNDPKRAWTAGLYDEARRGWLVPDKKDKTQSQAFTEQGKSLFKWKDWNEIRIVCQDNHIRIWLNGELRVDFTDKGKDATPEGFFGLQVHSGKKCRVRWRNLRLKTLPE